MFIQDYIIALPTPYQDGEIDFTSLGKMIEHIQANGYTRALLCGSTGDQHMLSLDEKKQLVDYVTNEYPNQKVMFGVSGIDTKRAKQLADYIYHTNPEFPVMLSIPPYVLPNENEVMSYVDTILTDFQGDVLFYNNERRTGVNISAKTINMLMQKWPNIKAVKEAGSNNQADFSTPYVYTGFDMKMIEPDFYNVTTVVGNILPKTALYFMKQEKALNHQEIQNRYQTLIEKLVPFGLVKVSKYVYMKQGIIASCETRRPMIELTEVEMSQIDTLCIEMKTLEQDIEEYV